MPLAKHAHTPRVCWQGQLCGSCAHVTALRRDSIGPYLVTDAWDLSALIEALQAPEQDTAASSGSFP